MTALGTIALASADVAFFSPPPHRPGRPARRSRGSRGVTRSFIRAFRRELARALDDADANRVRVTHGYPY